MELYPDGIAPTQDCTPTGFAPKHKITPTPNCTRTGLNQSTRLHPHGIVPVPDFTRTRLHPHRIALPRDCTKAQDYAYTGLHPHRIDPQPQITLTWDCTHTGLPRCDCNHTRLHTPGLQTHLIAPKHKITATRGLSTPDCYQAQDYTQMGLYPHRIAPIPDAPQHKITPPPNCT